MRGLDDYESETGSSARSPTEMSNGAAVTQSALSLLDRLRLCQSAWALGYPWNRESARTALWGRQTGTFLVLLDSMSRPHLLCMTVGDKEETVKDFPIQHTGAVFHISESHLGFSDLVQLVAYYSLSRDVLPVCLLIPQRVLNLTEDPQHNLSQLGPKSWLCSTSSQQPSHAKSASTGLSMCSIQVTSENGALCIINPLYVHEHGDSWLTERAPAQSSPSHTSQLPIYKRERRLSTTRHWTGAGLHKMRGPSLDHEPVTTPTDGSVSSWTPEPPASPSTPVVLRRTSQPSGSGSLRRGRRGSPADNSEASGETTPLGSPSPQSPCRVSWIEDGVWLSPPPLSTLLQPPCLELDSLSISSLEEESDCTPSPAHTHTHRLPLVLADKVKHRLSAVGQAIGGLMSPQKRLNYRVQELSERKSGAFAEAVRAFVEKMRSGSGYTSATELLQDVRSSLTSLKELLLESAVIQALTESLGDIPEWELDAMLELSIHKVALKPVCVNLYSYIHEYRQSDGSMQRLKENQHSMKNQSPEGLGGTAGVGLPDAVTLEKMQQRWGSMHEAYSPSKKVQILLKVCKSIYHSMHANSSPGAIYGADDFLPCLSWVVLHSDIITLQLDTDYMMELLDPSQLQGEGGYYLTSLYGSLFHISSFQPRLASRQLSTEAQRSLSQWHRRRTLHCNRSRRSRNRKTIRRPASREGDPRPQEQAKPFSAVREVEALESTSACTVEASGAAPELLEDLRQEQEGRGEAHSEDGLEHDAHMTAEGTAGPQPAPDILDPLGDIAQNRPEQPRSEHRAYEVLWTIPEDAHRDPNVQIAQLTQALGTPLLAPE